jgi:hypothetical protein
MWHCIFTSCDYNAFVQSTMEQCFRGQHTLIASCERALLWHRRTFHLGKKVENNFNIKNVRSRSALRLHTRFSSWWCEREWSLQVWRISWKYFENTMARIFQRPLWGCQSPGIALKNWPATVKHQKSYCAIYAHSVTGCFLSTETQHAAIGARRKHAGSQTSGQQHFVIIVVIVERGTIQNRMCLVLL